MKRVRPSKYKASEITIPEYTNEHPKLVVELMSQGYTPAQVQSRFKIGKSTYYDWQASNPSFKKAVEMGMAAGEAYYWNKAQEHLNQGDDKGYKYFQKIIDNVYGYNKTTIAETNIQINNNTLNVHQEKSREQLLEYINDELLNNRIIDIKALNGQKEENKVQIQSIEPTDENY